MALYKCLFIIIIIIIIINIIIIIIILQFTNLRDKFILASFSAIQAVVCD